MRYGMWDVECRFWHGIQVVEFVRCGWDRREVYLAGDWVYWFFLNTKKNRSGIDIGICLMGHVLGRMDYYAMT
jgi:hypothetical protein